MGLCQGISTYDLNNKGNKITKKKQHNRQLCQNSSRKQFMTDLKMS
jgi:hypothetical protein